MWFIQQYCYVQKHFLTNKFLTFTSHIQLHMFGFCDLSKLAR